MNENNTSKRQFFWAGIIIFWFYFVLMGIPNFVASDDFGMIMVFDPDEAAPLPSVFDMIKPQETLVSAVKNFLTYQYYIYGFPYFAYSALVILPLKFFGSLSDQFPLIMLILRQATSVLPMVFSAYWLVNLQTKYRNLWVGIFLLVFLLAVPAVVQNNFWWHPDGLTMLTVVAVIYFLNRDNFTYGSDFLWAAFACGISTGIKFTGIYFVLTIGVYLLWGFQRKH
ncbi:MAG: glycosyltransferase 87 family protein, partial [Anaerolineales bacterium]